MAQDLNSSSIEHRCHNGTVFRASRADLKGGVTVLLAPDGDLHDLVQDAIEFGAFHGLHIWQGLNGFTGYGRIELKMFGTSALGEETREG